MNLRKTLALSFLAPAFMAAGAAALNPPTHNHTVTLLADGNILVAGGRTLVNTVSGRVEMYDMAANIWVNWGNLNTPRSSHTATLMSDGRVLIAGGFTAAGAPTNSLEICDPIARTCAAGPSNLTTARGGHTATLLTAGANAGQTLLCGGQFNTMTDITRTCDYVTAGGAVAPGPDMASARVGHAAALLHSGRVLVSGGRLWDGTSFVYAPMFEMYDPVTNAWTPVESTLQGRMDHTATVLNNGRVMITGGFNAANRLLCPPPFAPDSLEADCWHIANPLAAIAQTAGSQGYLDSAVFFEQNGANLTVMEETFNLMPYRAARHTAVLETDGRWRAHRGYGNIYPTFFTDTPNLANTGTIIRLSPTGANTANIQGASTINFPLKFKLVRPVSGRLTNADIFISSAAGPAITIGNAAFTLGRSTAAADGKAVGRLLGAAFAPGDFDALMRLDPPSGTAVFTALEVESGNTPNLTNTLSSAFGPSVFPGETVRVTGQLAAQVAFTMPDIYRGRIMGTARITKGTITHSSFTVTLLGGTTAFTLGPPVSCDDVADTCLFTGNMTFNNAVGDFTNLTDKTTFYSSINMALIAPAPPPVTLSLELLHTADEVHIRDKSTPYIFTRSTAVVRGMIFSNHLAYTPKDNRWADLADLTITGLHSLPSFDHTAAYTPAGDTLLLGGRNCEAAPDTDCRRATLAFNPNSTAGALVPVVSGWAAGPALSSRRAFHTSTPLPGGGILTCGGTDGVNPLSACELLNPATGKWEPAGAMNSPRANHTATLLPNGNVLAAGGLTPGGAAVASAEIYYPEVRAWVPTGAMTTARQLHTATLLPDGNVLVIGGAGVSTYSATAELYITSAAVWLPGGVMADGRAQHTATLLRNGNVLAAGGVGGLGALRRTEIYNYLTRTFAAGPPMNFARYAHTATRLRDGRVLAAGGSDGLGSLRTCELYSGAGWVEPLADGQPVLLNYNRANHRAVLLPNGKVMVTGGEIGGVVQEFAESFNPDFPTFGGAGWTLQGRTARRARHTSVLTRDNRILNIGGWDGAQLLNTAELTDFSGWPDAQGLAAATTRQAVISTGTALFDYGGRVTLLGNTSNFHGITEGSGGGAGPMSSAHSGPRVYIQQLDNPSGFLIDLSTRIYTRYSPGVNTDWSRTRSSITIVTPSPPAELPRGWYQMRVAANGVFSGGFPVQVGPPRPAGLPSVPGAAVNGVSSATWTWDRGTVPAGGADGFAVYRASSGVFIATAAFADSGSVSYVQTGLAPNTPASIMVAACNQGGCGGLTKSATVHTLAAAPAGLTITNVGFETVTLTWSANSNTPITRYELSMARQSPDFAVDISTPVGFDDAFTATTFTVTGIAPNYEYYFRVRARNGDGALTAFQPAAPPYVSTVTVGQVWNVQGTPLSGHQISWSWTQSGGADYYEVYDVTNGTASAVLVGSTPSNYLTQTSLSTNTVYQTLVFPFKNTMTGPVRGSPGYSAGVYTLANPPAAWPHTGVSTGAITFNWGPNGNPSYTDYLIHFSSYSDFSVYGGTVVIGSSYTAGGFRSNTPYYARVYALNGNDIPTAPTSLGVKYTHAQAPAGVTAAGIAMSGVTLVWNTGANPANTYYEVRGSTNNFVTISTHVLFAQLFTGDTITISGLLTSTTYQFDVAAINGENIITARTRTPSVLTLAGPAGTPSGAVGGAARPGVTSVIAGTLPNGHAVSMSIPPAAFTAETGIAISSHSVGIVPYSANPCGVNTAQIPVLAVNIYSANTAQPFEPATFTIGYGNMTSPQIAQINQSLSKLVWARYNPVNGQCLPLETGVNTGNRTITASLNHFSVFQLIIKEPAANLAGVLIYPNPFFPSRGQGFVTFNNLPAAAKVNIYTLSGARIWEGTATGSGVLTWRGVNQSGGPAGSGVYFVSVKSTGGDKIFKLAVER